MPLSLLLLLLPSLPEGDSHFESEIEPPSSTVDVVEEAGDNKATSPGMLESEEEFMIVDSK